MTLDPYAKAIVDMAEAALPDTDLATLTPAQLREDYRRGLVATKPEPVARVVNLTIASPGGALPLRIYKPRECAQLPVLLYFHGGGFVVGDLAMNDGFNRTLCNSLDHLVVAVEYRLAPEHRFPAALEDAYAALSWVAAQVAGFGGDPERLCVGGDSAGANLAAVCCLLARERNGPAIQQQLLLYPMFNPALDSEAHRCLGHGYGLNLAQLRWFWQRYLNDPEEGMDWRVNPLQAADVAGLPTALVITAAYDPLRDDGAAYAKKLQSAGVRVVYRCVPGQIHGFIGYLDAMPAARHWLGFIKQQLLAAD